MSAVATFSDASEAATRLGHATYTGTVAPASRRTDAITAFADASEAATNLGHATYTGTVAPASRRDVPA